LRAAGRCFQRRLGLPAAPGRKQKIKREKDQEALPSRYAPAKTKKYGASDLFFFRSFVAGVPRINSSAPDRRSCREPDLFGPAIVTVTKRTRRPADERPPPGSECNPVVDQPNGRDGERHPLKIAAEQAHRADAHGDADVLLCAEQPAVADVGARADQRARGDVGADPVHADASADVEAAHRGARIVAEGAGEVAIARVAER